MARTGGERGGWLREGKQESATHAIEKSAQYRAAMARFADRAGERLTAIFGAAFAATISQSRGEKVFAGLGEHAGQPAAALYSATLDARMAMLCEGGLVDLLIGAMFGFEAANDATAAEAPKPPTALELRLIGEVAGGLAEALRDAFAPVADFALQVEATEIVEDEALLGPKDGFALLA